MESLLYECMEPPPSRAVLQAEIEHRLARFRDTHPQPARELPRDVSRMLKTIHTQLFDPALNVQALKHSCGLPDNNVSSRFKYEIGVPVKQYIDGLRLEAARMLLTETSYTVFEVAQAVGYYHLQTLYRAFYRRFGCTPGSLRAEQERLCAPHSKLSRIA